MSALYLVNDHDRTIWLAAEHDGKLYSYIPNVEEFVYNQPLSADFLIDRNLTYTPIDTAQAATIITTGTVGKIDGRSNRFLLDHFRSEPRKLNPTEVLGASPRLRADVEPTATEVAHAKAELLRTTPVGEWIIYKTYPPTANRQTALQLASDLRKGRVRAFADIPLKARIQSSPQGHHVVQIARERRAAPLKATRTAAPRKAVGQAASRRARTKVKKGT
ncbi:MAG: hypothetical protein AB7G47_19715 [Mycolicibacterium sp.]|uniref:hypothetical protein n=1 Tax=Mycolicibacterium sp. TaxID=2320850 RepID=UPI003D0D6CF6